MIMSIKLLSANTCGLADNFKRRQLMSFIKKRGVKILLLQETHSVKNKQKIWHSQWSGPCFFDHGTNDARGVAILVSADVNFEMSNIQVSGEGRYIILTGKLDDKTITIVNIYTPNQDEPQFYITFFDQLSQISSDLMMIGGDFNLLLDTELDRKGGKKVKLSKSAHVVNTFLNTSEWVDAWRFINPERFQFTYKRRSPLVMSRIDYWLVSMSTLQLIESCEIIPGILSDHAFVELEIKVCSHLRGPGLWKMNTTLLSNQDYVTEVNRILLNAEKN